jgi:hypothetical protein
MFISFRTHVRESRDRKTKEVDLDRPPATKKMQTRTAVGPLGQSEACPGHASPQQAPRPWWIGRSGSSCRRRSRGRAAVHTSGGLRTGGASSGVWMRMQTKENKGFHGAPENPSRWFRIRKETPPDPGQDEECEITINSKFATPTTSRHRDFNSLTQTIPDPNRLARICF